VGAKLRLDLARGHALIVVPSRIVGAHVLQAEPPIILQISPGFRRTVLACIFTAGHVAGPTRRGGVGSIGLGPGKTRAHGAVMGSLTGGWQWLSGVINGRSVCRQCSPAPQDCAPR